ncbi:helix-turn-helix domain-containing protein [Selenomonas massiliensis]|uniref:helix-turn-helix domain-containing protein n=1 Tax=Selenomonas massiliensis TaxID=2058293 RepID=UPI000D10ED49|nr:helix-turn-helix transcriptional regulator [Selenomonas massiliensis]
MAVSYKKLFHMLIDRNMTAAELQKEAGYSANISTRMRRDEYVSLDSIEKICRVLNCKVDDIVEFVPEGNSKETNVED